jgi:hypothetical protein
MPTTKAVPKAIAAPMATEIALIPTMALSWVSGPGRR